MSLAIVERKPQQQRRHGGFVSIFFQLLDWNRRLGKKKLLPRKLLPPVRAAKSPAKKFAADDKMPLAKLLLIDDENQGGFPSTKKTDAGLGHGMRPPGLVARLMGLESMPAVAHERPRKATDSGFLGKEECVQEFHRIDQDLCVEDGVNGKLDSRPQKLQKTGGFLERKPIDGSREKSGASGKKKVLSSPSNNKLHKPPSPVKSPRLPSGKLMKAATRILEPRLQCRSRAKSSITFIDSSLLNAKAIDAVTTLKGSNEPFSNHVLEASMSYERLGETMRLEQGDDESLRPQISSSSLEMSNASCSRCGSSENSFIALAMQDEQNRTRKASMPAQCKTRVHNNAKDLMERINHQNTNKTKQDGLSTMLWRNQLRQNQSTVLRDKIAFGSKVCSRKQVGRDANKFNGAKGSAFINRNLSNYRRVKSACEQNIHRRATGNNTSERNIARKRTISTSSIENVDIIHSSCVNPSAGRDLNNRKGFGHSHDSNRSVYKGVKSSSNNKKGDDFSFRNDGIVSFTFNSPVGHRSRSSSNNEVEKRTKNGCLTDIGYGTLLMLDAHSNNSTANKKTTWRGDELSSLLEQKIRELTSMDRDELVARPAWSASSLKDLGTACTSEQNDYDHGSGSSKKSAISSSINFSHIPILQADAHQYKEERKFSPAASVLDLDNNQLSPISIFDASFSNESCSVGSINASSAGKLQVELAESCNTTQSTDLDVDLLDSATSVDFRRSIIHKIQHLAYLSSCVFDTHCDKVRISQSQLCEARHFISNAVLLFENFNLYRPDGSADMSLESFLLDMLQAITDSPQTRLKIATSYTGVKELDLFRGLLFDCIIECLDSKCGWSCKSGYMTYFKEPFLSTREQLMGEVFKEISRWIDLRGKFLDDLVNNEMKDSTAKWTECKMEAFEAGMEIESNILQSLVGEMVIDFC